MKQPYLRPQRDSFGVLMTENVHLTPPLLTVPADTGIPGPFAGLDRGYQVVGRAAIFVMRDFMLAYEPKQCLFEILKEDSGAFNIHPITPRETPAFSCLAAKFTVRPPSPRSLEERVSIARSSVFHSL